MTAIKLFWKLFEVIVGLLLIWIIAVAGKRKKGDFYGLKNWKFAHRGLHDRSIGIPENCLTGFRRAVEAGYGAELDVHLSKDGRLVVMHDESLKRTVGIDRKICDMTSEELDQCRLEGTEEHIPYLEEVLPLFEGKAPLVVELKTNNNAGKLAGETVKLLDRFPKLQYCIESFDPRAIYWLHKHRPEIIRGQLSCKFEKGELPWFLRFAFGNLLFNCATMPHFVAYRFEDRKRLSLRLCKYIWGVQEVNWTIKSPETFAVTQQEGNIAIFEQFCP